MDNQPYNYQSAGFSRFYRRSIDNGGTTGTTLPDMARGATVHTRNIDFDQGQVAGALSGVTQVGTKITLDGIVGRIDIKDDRNNTATRLGELDA